MKRETGSIIAGVIVVFVLKNKIHMTDVNIPRQ
jgi:hypothetical protein